MPDDVSVLHVRLHLAGDVALTPRGRHEELHQLQESSVAINLVSGLDILTNLFFPSRSELLSVTCLYERATKNIKKPPPPMNNVRYGMVSFY